MDPETSTFIRIAQQHNHQHLSEACFSGCARVIGGIAEGLGDDGHVAAEGVPPGPGARVAPIVAVAIPGAVQQPLMVPQNRLLGYPPG